MNKLLLNLKRSRLAPALIAFLLAAPVASAADKGAHEGKTEGKAESKIESVQKHEDKIALTEAERSKINKGQVVIGNQPRPNGRRWVTAKIKIAANPAVVWEAVHKERNSDPDLAYSKVLEEDKNEKTLEQKFQLLPVIGTSVCVIKSTEIPHKRIDYYLLKSDRFKAVEGSWILEPTEDGGTILELGSYIDIGMPAPRSIIEGVAGKKLERRLSHVRKFAEDNSKAIAQKSESRN